MPPIQGPCFAPTHRDEFYAIVGERYNAARGEASRIGAKERIHMRIEFFKPKHFEHASVDGTKPSTYYESYSLPVGDTLITLQSNCAFFPYGLMTWDAYFDYMKWYLGNKVDYIGDWFVLPVYRFEEKQGGYKGNLEHYEFRAGETFTYTVHSLPKPGTPSPTEVDAWLLAFIVLPRTHAESVVYV